jgi:choline dehydrogenase-like flavoprotein
VTVLAAGAVENARILLLSDRSAAGGLGNQHDLVGRFYMEHPHCLAADLLFFDPKRDLARFEVYREPELGHVVTRAIHIAEETQRAERLLNFRAYLGPSIPDARARLEPDIIRSTSRLARVLGVRGMAPRAKTRAFRLRVSGEQEPDPESRIRLANERDRFGARKVRLNWRLSPADLRSIQRSLEIIGEEVGRTFAGRLHLRLDEERGWPGKTWGGHHHMGTTRMHVDPRQGVVDANAQVHGIGNLYITGGSVFPAVGVANPTLTIVALSVRLARHLAGRPRGGP